MLKRIIVCCSSVFCFLLVCSILYVFAQNFDTKNIIAQGDNYRIINIKKGERPKYQYEIINNYGKIVKTGTTERIEPQITDIGNSILEIRISAGSGLFVSQYYDINLDIFSERFESPAETCNRKIVYMSLISNSLKLVVRDIFDEAKYYKEFNFDFSPVANPADALVNVRFIDENSIDITYLFGKEYIEKSTIIQL